MCVRPSVALARPDSLLILFPFLTTAFTPHPPSHSHPQEPSSPELFFRNPNLTPLGFPLLLIFLQTKGVDEARPGPMHTWPLPLPPATRVLSQHTNCWAQDLASAASTPPHTRTPTWSPRGETFPSWSFGNNLTHFPRRWSRASRAFWWTHLSYLPAEGLTGTPPVKMYQPIPSPSPSC